MDFKRSRNAGRSRQISIHGYKRDELSATVLPAAFAVAAGLSDGRFFGRGWLFGGNAGRTSVGGVVLVDKPKARTEDAGDEGTDNNCHFQPPHLATPQARMGSGVNEFTQVGHAMSIYTL